MSLTITSYYLEQIVHFLDNYLFNLSRLLIKSPSKKRPSWRIRAITTVFVAVFHFSFNENVGGSVEYFYVSRLGTEANFLVSVCPTYSLRGHSNERISRM
ncbi:hypothetical protein ACFX2B_013079 [Malus domestica]